MDLAAFLPLAINATILLTVFGLGLDADWRDSGPAAKHERAAILLNTLVAALVSVPYVLWRKRQSLPVAHAEWSIERTNHGKGGSECYD